MHRHARRDGKTAWIAQFRLALPFDIDDETNGRFVFGASTLNRVSNTTLPSLVVACSDEVTFAASSAFVSSSSTVVSPYMGSSVRCFSTISSMLQSENSSVQPFGMWASTYFSSECASRLHRSHYIIASVAFVFGFSYPSATPRQCCHGVATGCASDGNAMITSRSPSTQSWRKIKNVTFFFEPKKLLDTSNDYAYKPPSPTG